METYELILMDLLMPGMSGYETTEKIREMGITTPIIVQSSMSSREDRRRCINTGCDAFLPKPVKYHDLLEVIKKHVPESPQDEPEKTNNKQPVKTDTESHSMILEHKVLLIEENKEQAARFSKHLESCGLNVLRVSNGNGVGTFSKT